MRQQRLRVEYSKRSFCQFSECSFHHFLLDSAIIFRRSISKKRIDIRRRQEDHILFPHITKRNEISNAASCFLPYCALFVGTFHARNIKSKHRKDTIAVPAVNWFRCRNEERCWHFGCKGFWGNSSFNSSFKRGFRNWNYLNCSRNLCSNTSPGNDSI